MKSYSSILIGINRYYFFQPLNYAQADAQALQQYLLTEANLSSPECLLLSDSSPWIEEQSTYPNRQTIFKWLNLLNPDQSKNLLSKGVFWFFFSGYGVHYQGEDYLLPIDGDPRDLLHTGINLRSLFEHLKQQASQVVVILDINRSPGVNGRTSLGEKAIQLAKEMELALILASQPYEFSHEASSLGNGIFTAAFLEALRYYKKNLTLANLDHYLRIRLPELSQHSWQPLQNPVIVIPNQQVSQTSILPGADFRELDENNLDNWRQKIPSVNQFSSFSFGFGNVATLPPVTQENGSTNPNHSSPKTPKNSQIRLFFNRPSQSLFKNFPQQFLLWLAIVSGGLFLGMIIPYLSGFAENKSDQDNPSDNSLPNNPISSNKPSVDEFQQQQWLDSARIYLGTNQASDFNQAINQARKIQPDNSLYPQAQENINRWSWIIFDIAQGRAKNENFIGAIAAAQLIPPEQSYLYHIAQSLMAEWRMKTEEQRTNQILLEAAQGLISSHQASSYNRAITTLKYIKPGESGYREAQQLINHWSRQIYLIANSRAARNKFQEAINTALLIPENTSSYHLGKEAIARWQNKNP